MPSTAHTCKAADDYLAGLNRDPKSASLQEAQVEPGPVGAG